MCFTENLREDYDKCVAHGMLHVSAIRTRLTARHESTYS